MMNKVECDEQDAEEIGKTAVKCIKRAGEFPITPLTGEYKISNNWSGTH